MSYSSEHPPTRVMHSEDRPPALASDEALQTRLALALQRASAYLLGRQSPDGGFCFYRGYYLEEPNLADTWHGLAVLCNLLRADLPQRTRHAEFVVSQRVDLQPFALYCRVRSLHALDMTDPHAKEVRRAVEALEPRLSDTALRDAPEASLNRLRSILWLKRHFGDMPPLGQLLDTLLGAECAQGGYGTPPNLIDTAAAVAVLTLCEKTAPASTGDFVARLAEPSYGFRLTADSLSPNLETTCAGVVTCSRLGLPVPRSVDALSFILSCQTGNGGFARAADALPSIALTHLAVVALAKCVQRRVWRKVTWLARY